MRLIRALAEHPEVTAIGVICLALNLQSAAKPYFGQRAAAHPGIWQLLDAVPLPPPPEPRLTIRSY